MAARKDYLRGLEIPRLAAVRVDPSQPTMTLRVPKEVVAVLPYEPFEYTCLGFLDAKENADESITVKRNFQAYLDCLKNSEEIVEIMMSVEKNVALVLNDGEPLPQKQPQLPWQMEFQIPPEIEHCIEKKLSEARDGTKYENRTLTFTGGDFQELAARVRSFFRHAGETT